MSYVNVAISQQTAATMMAGSSERISPRKRKLQVDAGGADPAVWGNSEVRKSEHSNDGEDLTWSDLETDHTGALPRVGEDGRQMRYVVSPRTRRFEQALATATGGSSQSTAPPAWEMDALPLNSIPNVPQVGSTAPWPELNGQGQSPRRQGSGQQHLGAHLAQQAASPRRSPRKTQPRYSQAGSSAALSAAASASAAFNAMSAGDVQSTLQEMGVSVATRGVRSSSIAGPAAAADGRTAPAQSSAPAGYSSSTHPRIPEHVQMKKVKVENHLSSRVSGQPAQQQRGLPSATPRSQAIAAAIRSSEGVVPEHLLYLLDTDSRHDLSPGQVQVQAHAEAEARAQAHAHAQVHAQVQAHARAQAQAQARAQRAQAQAHAHAQAQAHAQALVQAHAHAHAQAQAQVQALARAHSKAQSVLAQEANLPKVKTADGMWEEWVLNLGAKARNTLIKERRFADDVIVDLKQTVRKRQWVHAARRYKARKRSK